jgi:hypothetical protein
MSPGRTVRLSISVLAVLLVMAGSPAALAAVDHDHDGIAGSADCKPLDPLIYPGAADVPDLAFRDTNCDGTDGTAADAVFVYVGGSDNGLGTRANPLQTITAGITQAKEQNKDVYVTGGFYNEVVGLETGVNIYGGYVPYSGSRSTSEVTTIKGAPQAVLADGDTGVVLQLLTLKGSPVGGASDSDRTAYGLRAINGSSVALIKVTASAADGLPGANGADGSAGAPGGTGSVGGSANFCGPCGGPGAGGTGANAGGAGGFGGCNATGGTGTAGAGPGGAGGAGGGVGAVGLRGTDGLPGGAGGPAPVVAFSTAHATQVWAGATPAAGSAGTAGRGGGGGGGGGGNSTGCGPPATGGGGGGGGGGGAPGAGGQPGGNGGASIGVYVADSQAVLDRSVLAPGDGGAGGNGGAGGGGGAGGFGGNGGMGASSACGADGPFGPGGRGGDGGVGGAGGAGAGGAGGPSAGIMRVGSGTFVIRNTSSVVLGTGGAGGARGTDGTVSEGAPASTGLPNADNDGSSDFDGDGVVDITDKCADIPKGTYDVNSDGCADDVTRPVLLPAAASSQRLLATRAVSFAVTSGEACSLTAVATSGTRTLGRLSARPLAADVRRAYAISLDSTDLDAIRAALNRTGDDYVKIAVACRDAAQNIGTAKKQSMIVR